MSEAERIAERRVIGLWAEWPQGLRWSNEGMTRLLGFLIEGMAKGSEFTLAVVVPDHVRDTAEADLRALDAVYGRDFTIHSPRDAGLAADGFDEVADFANRHVPVDGWLTLFPTFTHARRLNAPVTTVFPDAIPAVFHEFADAAWRENGDHVRWARSVETLLKHATRVITFSKHVARDHAQRLFALPADKIVTIPHAAPDLSNLLGVATGERTHESVGRAAELLRREARRRGWKYLYDFPFEETHFVAVSTQDRVTKNLQLIPRIVEIIVRERRQEMKAFLTAEISFGSKWSALPSQESDSLMHFDLLSVPDLPRPEHAALLHCASAVVHPSIFEGGHAPFPFYEAVSVGTPCLVARGPHVAELAESEPRLLDFTFDPNDADGLAAQLLETLARREEIFGAQRAIYDRLSQVHWSDVAAAYGRTVSGAGNGARLG